MKEYTKLRADPRAILLHPVQLLGVTGLLIDVSEKGMRLRGLPLGLPLKPNEIVEIKWQPLVTLEPEVLQARCRWTQGTDAGLSLVNPSKRVRHFIRALVRYHRNSEV